MRRAKRAYNTAAKHIHDTQQFAYNDKPVKELHKALNAALQDAVNTGITHEVPATMLSKIKQDVFVFSGMKTYAELKELSSLLIDADGRIKAWPKYLQDATQLNKVNNEHYLEAEYLQAVGTSQALDKYLEFEKDGDAYDLQIRTAQDDKVRDSHAVLHNITLPFSHPFWDTHWIPFDWRCRCNIVQVRKGKYPVTDTEAANAAGKAAVPEMFRYNPAKAQVIFPPKHPYYAQQCGKKLNVTGSIELAKIVLSNERDKCEWQKRLKEEQYANYSAKDTKKWAKSNLRNLIFTHKEVGEIKLTGGSIDEFTNQPFYAPGLKRYVLENLQTVLDSAKYMGAREKQINDTVRSHILEVKFSEVKSWLIVRENVRKEKILYSISDGEKVLDGLTKK